MKKSNAMSCLSIVAISFESLVQNRQILTTQNGLQKQDFVHAFGLEHRELQNVLDLASFSAQGGL
jgi:hypothetical protein